KHKADGVLELTILVRGSLPFKWWTRILLHSIYRLRHRVCLGGFHARQGFPVFRYREGDFPHWACNLCVRAGYFLVYLHCRLLRDFRSHRYASTWVIRSAAMPVEVGEGFRVVVDHGVEVEGLRVGEVGVGDCDGDVG